jgi:hypothetical protein
LATVQDPAHPRDVQDVILPVPFKLCQEDAVVWLVHAASSHTESVLVLVAAFQKTEKYDADKPLAAVPAVQP